MSLALRAVLAAIGVTSGIGRAVAEEAPPAIVVVPSAAATELLPLLTEELGGQALRADGVLRLVVEERGGQLQVVLQNATGVILAREFALAQPRVGALRAAVLAIAEARRLEAESVAVSPPPPPPPPPAPPPPATEPEPPVSTASVAEPGQPRSQPTLAETITPTASIDWWWGLGPGLILAGATPQLGVEWSGARRFGAWRLGLGLSLHGLGCCLAVVDTQEATALDGRFLMFSGRVEFEWTPLSPLGLAFGLAGALGVAWVRLDAHPALFPGDETRTQTTGVTGLARLGLVGRGALGTHLGWFARGGLELRSAPVAVVLPDGFPIQSDALALNRYAPYLLAGLEVGWF